MGTRPVLILYCEEGEGHASAARALAERLEAVGVETVVHDALQDGLGRLIPLCSRDAYRIQVRWLRWTYGLEFFLFTRVAPARALARFGLALLGARPMLRLIGRHEPSVVISTHPAVTNVLGALRRRGRLDVPVVATITDFGIHALWAHPAVDLHLVMHERLTAAVERIAGRGSVRAVDFLVDPRYLVPKSQLEARLALGLPPAGQIALVSGGGWGVGAVERAVAATLAVPGVSVVCLAGRNEHLARRLKRRFADVDGRLAILPFTEQMPTLLAAADVLVDATLGVTCLEALALGRRVIAFGAPPGHSRVNARALTSLGLASRARSPRRLAELLTAADRPPPELPRAGDPATAVLTAAPRRREARRRRPALVALWATLGTLVLAGWSLGTPMPYPVLSRALDLSGLSGVQTDSPVAGVIVEAPTRRIPQLARSLSARGIHVSFAVATPPSSRVRRAIVALHDGLLPTATPPRVPGVEMVSFSARVHGTARRLGIAGSYYYLRPQSGYTLGDYLAALMTGGRPISPAIVVGPKPVHLLDLDYGRVVLVDATGPNAAQSVTALATLLSSRSLRGVSLADLLASAASDRATEGARASAQAPVQTSSSDSESPTSRSADAGQPSPASRGASATGTTAVSANTSGAVCETGRNCSEDISLSVPTPDATPIATAQAAAGNQT